MIFLNLCKVNVKSSSIVGVTAGADPHSVPRQVDGRVDAHFENKSYVTKVLLGQSKSRYLAATLKYLLYYRLRYIFRQTCKNKCTSLSKERDDRRYEQMTLRISAQD